MKEDIQFLSSLASDLVNQKDEHEARILEHTKKITELVAGAADRHVIAKEEGLRDARREQSRLCGEVSDRIYKYLSEDYGDITEPQPICGGESNGTHQG